MDPSQVGGPIDEVLRDSYPREVPPIDLQNSPSRFGHFPSDRSKPNRFP